MDNIQELFTYPAAQQGQPQQAGAPATTQSYTTLGGTKEIYAHNLNVQPFNYDPNTQWISMPVINSTGQSQTVGQIQQVRLASICEARKPFLAAELRISEVLLIHRWDRRKR